MDHTPRLISTNLLRDCEFNKFFHLVHGIFPQLTQFINNILIPLSNKEKKFAGWQEAARKDVKRVFGVLQCRWHLLAIPIVKFDEVKIQHMMISCFIMHNTMVEERLEHGDDFSGDYFNDGNGYETDQYGNVNRISSKAQILLVL